MSAREQPGGWQLGQPSHLTIVDGPKQEQRTLISVRHGRCRYFLTECPEDVVRCPYCGAHCPPDVRAEVNSYVGKVVHP